MTGNTGDGSMCEALGTVPCVDTEPSPCASDIKIPRSAIFVGFNIYLPSKEANASSKNFLIKYTTSESAAIIANIKIILSPFMIL